MAVIYLKHPVHGAKVASSDMEAYHDRACGWEDFDPHADTPPSLPAFLGGVAPATTPLPEDFPGRLSLVESGYETLERIPRDAEELVKIKGIGNATALRILDILAP